MWNVWPEERIVNGNQGFMLSLLLHNTNLCAIASLKTKSA